jgi:hypothetical protein
MNVRFRRYCVLALLLAMPLAPTLALTALAAAKQGPDAILRGDLAGVDNQRWRLVPFEVPPGTTRITVDFDYTTRDLRTTIDIGILGPDGFRGQDGFRGWSGGNKRSFTISATDATPSYLPGPIRPGQWNLLLGIPNIRQDSHAQYTASVRFERGGTGQAPAQFGPVLRDQPGWYRGDLHMHTAHSDGSCLSRRQQRVPCPIFLTARTASERGLDFIAITDHNTISHADAIRELQPYFDDLLLIPGREITTFHGHANLLGSVALLDFRVGSGEVPDWNVLLAKLEDTGGGVLSINHPVRSSGEQCMGCGWTPEGAIDYARIQAVEVVNGLDADTPWSGIGFWQHLLDQGYELTALGGSDNHDALQPAANVTDLRRPHDADAPSPETLSILQHNSGAIGTPTTVIYADELSQTGIVAAIRRGRVFIDVAGTRNRALDLTATAAGQVAHMGDALVVPAGVTVHFEGRVNGVAGGEVEVILDGRRAFLLQDPSIHSAAKSFDFLWHADGQRHWLRLDVRDDASHLALIGNPIYLLQAGPR